MYTDLTWRQNLLSPLFPLFPRCAESLNGYSLLGQTLGSTHGDATSSMDPVCEDATVAGMDRWLLRCGVPDRELLERLAGDVGSASDWSLLPVRSASDCCGWLSRGTCWTSVSRAADRSAGHHVRKAPLNGSIHDPTPVARRPAALCVSNYPTVNLKAIYNDINDHMMDWYFLNSTQMANSTSCNASRRLVTTC